MAAYWGEYIRVGNNLAPTTPGTYGIGVDPNGSYYGLTFYDAGTAVAKIAQSTSGGLIVGSTYATTATTVPTGGALIQGNVGIGTTAPVATLDVNGYVKLKSNSAAPVTCDAAHEGAAAYTGTTTHYMCFCNGTNWVKFTDNILACAW